MCARKLDLSLLLLSFKDTVRNCLFTKAFCANSASRNTIQHKTKKSLPSTKRKTLLFKGWQQRSRLPQSIKERHVPNHLRMWPENSYHISDSVPGLLQWLHAAWDTHFIFWVCHHHSQTKILSLLRWHCSETQQNDGPHYRHRGVARQTFSLGI